MISNLRPLPGFVKEVYVSRQGKKYGPYYVRIWKEKGVQRRAYIKPHDLEDVIEACELNKMLRTQPAIASQRREPLLSRLFRRFSSRSL